MTSLPEKSFGMFGLNSNSRERERVIELYDRVPECHLNNRFTLDILDLYVSLRLMSSFVSDPLQLVCTKHFYCKVLEDFQRLLFMHKHHSETTW